jgi:hypothetical protein
MLLAWFFQPVKPAAIVQDRTHASQTMHEDRQYRIFLPPAYPTSLKRYPVIYFFHGWSERSNQSAFQRSGMNYDEGTDFGGDNISNFVASHDVIVVKWDGTNPRTPDEFYLRPYNVGPVETARQFPLYFTELVEHIDRAYRTLADRDHRAVCGFSMGGFMSYWIAGEYPGLIGSASAFMPSTEFSAGPKGFDVEYRHADMYRNYDGVRVRLVTGSKDFIRFYHRALDAVWKFTVPHYEREDFDAEHGVPGMAKTLDFHLRSFAAPLPRPAVWSHASVYPNFDVWGWQVGSNRRRPGITLLENVSKSGFRSVVREWLPAGASLPEVKLLIASAQLYPPSSVQHVTYVRLRDGKVRRQIQKADASGRLDFELDGGAYEVGIGPAAVLALPAYELEAASWATAGRTVHLRVRFWNKGAARSAAAAVRWESPNPGVAFSTPLARVFALNPGESTAAPLVFTVADPAREIVRIVGNDGANRFTLDVPLFPAAPPAKEFQIADGRTVKAWQQAVHAVEVTLGEGNGDGFAAPGERFAVLLPDGEALRAAEVFTNDSCVDNTVRASDAWSEYDHVGESAKYSLPSIRADCQPGHVVHLLARVLLPDKPEHRVRYAAIEFPVWWRTGEAVPAASPASGNPGK